MMPDCCLSLASPKTVSIWIPWVMYIIDPASATALSPGSSSTSTNCISVPEISKSISWAVRPGGVGTGARPGLPSAEANWGMSFRRVQSDMPDVNR